ncbi:MAG: ATP-binding protein [Victivallaceae bacterium]|jgi:signal transduction histidine kinase
MNQKVNFNAHAHIKSIIGKDLINDDNIAVVELVKNAIDAQSKTVSIVFNNLLSNDDEKSNIYDQSLIFSTLIIKDDGLGMSYDDIINKWLNIAYSEKKLNKNKAKKYYAGSKGVGRFSCDRLGEFLNIYTRKKSGDIFHLHVNWKDFEVDNEIDLKIQDIKLDLRKISDNEFKNKFHETLPFGTILEIAKLRTPWLTKYQRNTQKGEFNREKLLTLKRSLGKIVSPNIEIDSDAQLISLSVPVLEDVEKSMPEIKRVNGIVENKIFKELNFRTTSITSIISNDGNSITTTLIDKSREILRIKEANVDYPDLKDTHIKIYYLDPYAKAYFKKQTGVRAVEYGSIFLFLGGFRVSKLGDAHDDWLGLEKRKAQGRARYLSGRELIGHIEINDPNHKIGIISAREGITKTPISEQLTARTLANNSSGFFYKTLRRLERYVVDGLDWDTTSDKILDIEKLIDAGNWSEKNEKYDLTAKDKIERIYKAIGSIVDQDTRKKNILELYINFDFFAEESENIAADAQESFDKFVQKHNIDIASLDELKKLKHQVKQEEFRANKAEQEKKEAQREAREEQKRRKEIEKEKKKLKEFNYFQNKQIHTLTNITDKDVNTLVSYLHHIGIYSDAVETNLEYLNKILKTSEEVKEILADIIYDTRKISVLSRLGQKTNIEFDGNQNYDIISYITQYINEVLKGVISEPRNIKICNKCPDCFNILGNPTDISILIDNLLHNSSKAEAQNVTIELRNINSNKLCIRYSDDGNGLNKSIENRTKILELGFTTTNGFGMGLYHISNIIKSYNGQIIIPEQPSKGFLIEFIIEV